MTDEKIGPWKKDDLSSFLALEVEFRPPAAEERNELRDLFGFNGSRPFDRSHQLREQEQAHFVEQGWNTRRAHPVYKWLETNPNFRAAYSAFEKRRKAAKTGRLTLSIAPFFFLREYVRHADFACRFCGLAGSSDYGAHARRRRSAVKHARALCELLDSGIHLQDFEKNLKLRASLVTLASELSDVKRKEYGGKRETERWVLTSLARGLVIYCDLSSPSVITNFARMVDIACEMKTARRYCIKAENENRKALAEALRSTTTSTLVGK